MSQQIDESGKKHSLILYAKKAREMQEIIVNYVLSHDK